MFKGLRPIFLVCLVLLCSVGSSRGDENRSARSGPSEPHLGQAATWRQISNGLDTNIQSLAADPGDPNIFYAGSASIYGLSSAVYKSTDGGANWFPSDTGIPANTGIVGLHIDPNDYDVLYARASKAALYKSINRGTSWGKVDGLPEDIWCLAVYGSTLYVGGYDRAYVSPVDTQATKRAWMSIPPTVRTFWWALGDVSPAPRTGAPIGPA